MRKTFLALALAALCGCSSISVETTVNADGSFSRSLSYTLAKSPMGGDAKIEDLALLPSGEAWKVTRSKRKDDTLVKATADFKKGSGAVTDLQLLQKLEKKQSFGFGRPKEEEEPAPKAKLLFDNQVTVRQIAPGKFEYREVLRWKGKRKANEMPTPDEKELKEVFAKLPEALRTEKEAKKIAEQLGRSLLQSIFGPSEPLLPHLLLNTTLAFRLIRIRTGNDLIEWMEKEYGDKLSEDQRVATVRSLLEAFDMESQFDKEFEKSKPKVGGAPKPTEEKEDDEKVDFVALNFALNFPGKVIETNGKLDRFSGRVFWSVYPQASEIGDVELRAVFTTK